MASKILATRMLAASSPMRLCLTSNASMSSSSLPSKTASSLPSSEPIKNPVRKRESIRSILASMFGGKVDSADPNADPIPASKVNFPDVTESATGEYKLFLLAFENGFLDPYSQLPIERKGRGTKDNPIPIESFVDERIVGCVCEESQSFIRYSVVYKGEPKRCACGHWMKLVEAPRFWEKIPKEDLLTIPYFRELEEEGKLDKLLSGELKHEMIKEH